jgi:biopolymer transport protein ExbB
MHLSVPRLSRFGRGLIAFLLILSMFCCTVNVAHAQDEPPKAEKKDDKKAETESNNFIVHVIFSVGWFWLLLLPLSLGFVALNVLLMLDLRPSTSVPAGFVDEFTDTVNKRKFKEAFDMAKNDPSFLGRVLTAGMGRLQYGLEDARESSMNSLESIKSDKDQKNNYNAVIATLGPLLGLVGTVTGMIISFKGLAAGDSSGAAGVAGGVAHALCVTLIGVAIACPAIVANTFFRNRITQVSLDVSHVSDDLLTQMYHNSKKAAAGAPAAPPAAPK